MNQQLIDQVVQSPRLPTLPAIALKVISLVQDPEVDFREIVDVIQHDPALSSQILKTVNSAFYGQPREVSSISRALQVLGLSSVKTLALGFSLVANLKDKNSDGGFDHVGYWRRSLFTATAARVLARRAEVLQREEAFLGGLLQDVGMVAMNQALNDDYAVVLEQAGQDHAALVGHEIGAFGVDHAAIGGALAEHWGLPPLLVALIRHHEDAGGSDEEHQTIVRCVALGNRVAEIFIDEEGDGAALATYYDQAEDWFGVGRGEAEALLREIHEGTKDMGRLFELPTGNLGNPDAILARANEALMQLTLQSQQENRQLVVDVNTDTLTGAANRRAFDSLLVEAFAHATTSNPLTVLFVDIDHFKRFNDTYGHAVGDRVLIEFARALQRAVQDRGKVFRCGGEEFGIVCPGTTSAASAIVAEDARQTVEKTRVTSDEGEELGITCSIGGATHTGGTYEDIGALLKAADERLYDAKEAGRNCVRITGLQMASGAA